jgi:hypothetical protein
VVVSAGAGLAITGGGVIFPMRARMMRWRARKRALGFAMFSTRGLTMAPAMIAA